MQTHQSLRSNDFSNLSSSSTNLRDSHFDSRRLSAVSHEREETLTTRTNIVVQLFESLPGCTESLVIHQSNDEDGNKVTSPRVQMTTESECISAFISEAQSGSKTDFRVSREHSQFFAEDVS